MNENNAPPINKRTRIIIMASVMLATMMQTLDTTIANVALPHIQGSLSGTQSQIAWIITSYIIAAAITIPLTGWLASYFGRRRILLISIFGFMMSSVLCGIAENLPEIVIFRFLQGVCGAGLIPLSQAILLSISSKEEFGKAMAIWGLGVTMGPILGPIIGGYLTENYSWRWVFYINVPIGALAFLGTYFFLSESSTQKRSFDFFGFITLSIGVSFLQLTLDRGELLGWFQSKEILAEAAISCLGFYFFFVHTFSLPKTFLNLALFKNRNFSLAVILIFTLGIALFITLALVPTMLQGEFNYPVVTAGAVTAAQGAGTMLAMLLVGHALKKIDARHPMLIGILLIALSLWQMSHFSLQMNLWGFIIPFFLQGFGVGLAYVPLGVVAFADLADNLRDEGTAFFNLMRNIGSSIGISVVEAYLTSNTQIVHSSLGASITSLNTTTKNLQALASLNNTITTQAKMIAYLNDFYLTMFVTLSVIPAILLLKKIVPSHQPAAGIE